MITTVEYLNMAGADAGGYVARDLIPAGQFETLVAPFREAGIDLP